MDVGEGCASLCLQCVPSAVSPGWYLRWHLARVHGTLQELGAGIKELPGSQVMGAVGTEQHQQGEGTWGTGMMGTQGADGDRDARVWGHGEQKGMRAPRGPLGT